MSKKFKSRINFKLTKLKKADSKFRITKIHENNDKYDDLTFGNKFDILTKIDPNLDFTFTIIDEIDDKLILSYGENVIHNLVGFGANYTEHLIKYHAFDKNEFLKQISYLKTSQSSWDEPIPECFWEPSDYPRIHFGLQNDQIIIKEEKRP